MTGFTKELWEKTPSCYFIQKHDETVARGKYLRRKITGFR
jgi:hypothetical protein